jgi:ssDNA-binding Zn-finger/Zn-ribbon topoisomerase 1
VIKIKSAIIPIKTPFCPACGQPLEKFAFMKNGKVVYPILGCPNCANQEYQISETGSLFTLEEF